MPEVIAMPSRITKAHASQPQCPVERAEHVNKRIGDVVDRARACQQSSSYFPGRGAIPFALVC
eukprot:44645-Eustigmatos_ZCMA.PRE.1